MCLWLVSKYVHKTQLTCRIPLARYLKCLFTHKRHKGTFSSHRNDWNVNSCYLNCIKLLKSCISVDEIFKKKKKRKEEIYGDKQIWLSPNSQWLGNSSHKLNNICRLAKKPYDVLSFSVKWNRRIVPCMTSNSKGKTVIL